VNVVGVEGATPVVVAEATGLDALVEFEAVAEVVAALFLLTSTTTTPITAPS
jgi:hypothetical protein